MAQEENKTIYERVSSLEEELKTLKKEAGIVKDTLRNNVARHEISMIKKGNDIKSIID